jgi:hypothetical protein
MLLPCSKNESLDGCICREMDRDHRAITLPLIQSILQYQCDIQETEAEMEESMKMEIKNLNWVIRRWWNESKAKWLTFINWMHSPTIPTDFGSMWSKSWDGCHLDVLSSNHLSDDHVHDCPSSWLHLLIAAFQGSELWRCLTWSGTILKSFDYLIIPCSWSVKQLTESSKEIKYLHAMMAKWTKFLHLPPMNRFHCGTTLNLHK